MATDDASRFSFRSTEDPGAVGTPGPATEAIEPEAYRDELTAPQPALRFETLQAKQDGPPPDGVIARGD
jgi:hypothetical protein